MNLTIKGLDKLEQRLNEIAKKKLPYAVASALSSTAYGGMEASRKELKDSFDRPTPWVLRSPRYEKAEPSSLGARVYLTDAVRDILAPHISGGPRVTVKASERRLRRFGFMGADQYITPGPAAPLDRYGNISGPNMSKILSYIKSYQESGYTGKKQARAARDYYFVPRVGVFKRARGQKGQGQPVLFFSRRPQYEQRFDFHYALSRHVARTFPVEFQNAWARQLR